MTLNILQSIRSVGLIVLVFAGCFHSIVAGATIPMEPLAQIPVTFEPNRGQADSNVRFLSRSTVNSILLTDRGAQVQAPGAKAAITLRTVSGMNARSVEGLDATGGTSNYFVGRKENWLTGLPNYKRVRYSRVYPGVDWVFHGDGRNLEYDFVVAPGADPKKIEVEFDGVKALRVSPGGDLLISSRDGDAEYLQRKPVVYQIVNGNRVEVAGSYAVRGSNRIAFQIGGYDPSKELVIDPVLIYSAIVSGLTPSSVSAIAADAAGNTYLAGNTQTDFPGTGLRMGTDQGGAVLVFKLNPTGTNVLYSALIRGSQTADATNSANAIAIDSQGNVYVTGYSSAIDFPVTANAVFQPSQSSNSGTYPIVFSLNSSGTSLRFSTYLNGGEHLTQAEAVAVDGSGNVYIGGTTYSPGFATTPGAFQTTFPTGSTAGFVTKLNSTGSALVYSTLLSGPAQPFMPNSAVNGIAVDGSGNAYVAGTTTDSDFPTTAGAFEATGLNALGAGFVTKLNPAGTGLIYSTLITGTSVSANAISLDSSGNAYVQATAGPWITRVS